MLLGNTKKFRGIGYVCFLDILGFSQDILSNWKATDSNPLDKILAIKSSMPVFEAQEDDTEQSPHSRQYVCRVNTVSDSITIGFGFEPDLIVGDLILGLEALLANVSEVWATAIRYGYTIRGAIEFGEIYWDENELIGPAFINAYRLESEVARVSRVIVSSRLNRVLKDLANDHRGDITDHLIANFRKDVDGYVVVNPYILGHSDEERLSLAEKLRALAENSPTPLVKEKYAPLISMLSEKERNAIGRSELGAY